MTRELFTEKVKAQIANLKAKEPQLELSGDNFRVIKLKNGWRAYIWMPLDKGANNMEIDWRDNNPQIMTVSVEVPSGLNVRFKPVAKIPA